jgi:hypothetical protein
LSIKSKILKIDTKKSPCTNGEKKVGGVVVGKREKRRGETETDDRR